MSEMHAPRVDGMSIGSILRETARRAGPSEAMVFPQFGARLSYGESLSHKGCQAAIGLG